MSFFINGKDNSSYSHSEADKATDHRKTLCCLYWCCLKKYKNTVFSIVTNHMHHDIMCLYQETTSKSHLARSLTYHSFASNSWTEAVIIGIKMALIQLLLLPIDVKCQRNEVTTQLILQFQFFITCKLVAQRPVVLNDSSSKIFRQLH